MVYTIDLIRENTELTARLALAEKWMRREVQSAIMWVKKGTVKKSTRKHFSNIFEEEGIEIITKRILDQFDSVLDHAPQYTLERLIDAEIYWETLQRYPHMDALPIVLAYQKILDAWIEERLIGPWRESEKWKVKSEKHESPYASSLGKDLENIITKKYTLSIGRLYQIIEMIRDNSYEWGGFLSNLIEFWKVHDSSLLDILISDHFFVPLSELMKREIFSKKRHEKKVSFSDVKSVREILIWNDDGKGILHKIF